ncbi:PQQ-binding-like beta-propeller repeat protein [Planctomycetota bacterium]
MLTSCTKNKLGSILLVIVLNHVLLAESIQSNWPQFRGPNCSGIADKERPPIEFGPETNVKWKIPIPAGVSSPIVWDDRIFLTAFTDDQLVTLAFDSSSGREIWRRIVPTEKIEKCSSFSSPAASTPCTDGERVYAYFGSYGVLAYDFEGKEIWKRPYKRLGIRYGTATSPIIVNDRLILQRDGNGADSQIVALSISTGETIWELPRSEGKASYSTPMVWRHDGIEELIVLGKGYATAYSLDGGKPNWWVRGWGVFEPITTPVAGNGMLFIGGTSSGDPSAPPDPVWNWNTLIQHDSNKDGQLAQDEIPESLIWHLRKEVPAGEPGSTYKIRNMIFWFIDTNKDKILTKKEWDESEATFNEELKIDPDRLVCIRPGGKEDCTYTHVRWQTTDGIPEMPSPLFYRGRVHMVRNGGIWSVLEPETGKRLVDRVRLGTGGGHAVASPIAANGYIYVVNERGTFAVIRASDSLNVVALNKLKERVRSTPAIAGDALYVRTHKHLWAFAD